jgi:glutathione S-transferase
VSIAAARPRDSVIEARRKAGYEALDAMERELAEREFLVDDCYTIADIALYAYTHVAGNGGFDLSRYPAVCRWLDRVATQSGHVLITA